MATGRTPVLVGVGQVTNHWMPNDGLATAPSPTSLCVQASERALADAGITAAQIEMLAVARTIADSTPRPRHAIRRIMFVSVIPRPLSMVQMFMLPGKIETTPPATL